MDNKIVFFDGVCGLCNWFVDFLMKRNHKGLLRFAPLQGSTAAKELNPKFTSQLETVVFKNGDKIFVKSTAAIEILRVVGGVWSLMVLFYAIPRFLRDWVYNFIASNRYSWFGKRETCRLPTPQERSYFLD